MTQTKSKKKIAAVLQVIETDDIEAANVLIKSGNWILLNTYKKYYRHMYYVLGRIKPYNSQ